MSDVQDLARGVLELFQRQRGLAAAGAADDDQRRWQAIDRFLSVVEGNHLVEQVNLAPFRMDVTHRRGFGACGDGIDVGNLRVVDTGAAQKARPVVGVLLDHLQHQSVDSVAMTHQRKQHPVRVIELRAVELAMIRVGELLHVGLTKIIAFDGFPHFPVLRLYAGGVETGVLENLHASNPVQR